MIPARAAEPEALAAILSELRLVRAELAQVKARLPPAFGSLKQAAEVLGCDQSTVWRAWKRGEIPGRRVGTRVVVDLAALAPATDEDAALALQRRGR